MGIKNIFLKDVKIGNKIEIIVGTKTIEGIIVGLDMETVRIRRDDAGIANIALDMMSYYEILDDCLKDDIVTSERTQYSTIVGDKKNCEIVEIKNDREKCVIDIVDLFAGIKNTYDISYENLYKTYCKLFDGELKVLLNRTNDMVNYAKKIHEYSIMNDRVRRVITELCMVGKRTGSKYPYILIAGIYNDFKMTSEVRDYLLQGEGYKELFYYAINKSDISEALNYAILSVQKNMQDSYMVRWLCEHAKKENRIDIIELLCSRISELRLNVLLYWYSDSKVLKELPNKMEVNDEINLPFLLDILERDCNNINHIMDDRDRATDIIKNRNTDNEKGKELSGEITKFSKKEKWGFINATVPFYIAQVYDKDLQRKLLSEIDEEIYTVKYKLGRNSKGNKAAYQIELISTKKEDVHSGFIDKFMAENDLGVVREGNKTYPFLITAVLDPLLRADMVSSFYVCDQDVKFKIKKHKEKKVAYDIVGVKNYDEDQIQTWISQKYITQQELDEWKSRNNKMSSISTFEYCPLEPYKENKLNVEHLEKDSNNTVINEFIRIREQSTSAYGKGFCVKAHTCLVNGDLSKAELLYIEALKAGERIETTVPDLNAVYMRTNQLDKSIKLLDAYSHLLKREVYVNLKIQTLTKAKINSNELLDLYNEAFESTDVPARKMHYLLQMAQIYNEASQYKKALTCFESWEKYREKNKNILSGNYDISSIYILRGKAFALYKLGKVEMAQEYAREVLKLRPDDTMANSIISNDDVSTQKEIVWDDSWRDAQISKYIVDTLREFNLGVEGGLKIKDGIYVGDEATAVKSIGFIINRKTANDASKSSNYFAAAKIVEQILERGVNITRDKEINEQKYQLYVAKGMLFFADSQLSDAKILNNYDMARYCYLQVTNVFKGVDKIYSCWLDAFYRYIQTYFMDINDVTKRPAPANETCSYDVANEKIIELCKEFNADKYELDYNDFAVGLILLFANNPNNKKFGEIVCSCLEKSNMWEFVEVVLKDIINCGRYNIHDLENISNDEKWRMATNAYMMVQDDFSIIIRQVVDMAFSTELMLAERFENHDFLRLANKTERNYFQDIFKIFRAIAKYTGSADFDVKYDLIREIDQKIKYLEQQISKTPTLYTYEFVLDVLKMLEDKVYPEAIKLYGDAKPYININVLKDECSLNYDSKTAYVPINFTNKENVQNAENVQIKVSGVDIELMNENVLKGIKTIKGDGKPESILILFKVPQSVIDSQVLEFSVKITYEFRKNMNESDDNIGDKDNEEQLVSVPFYDQSKFELIENKFAPYIAGDPVMDKSMFFGRKKDIEEIVDHMMDSKGLLKKGKGLALYGQTRTGKSSLLYHLENRLRELDCEHNIIINTGSIGDQDLHDQNITELLFTILKSLSKELVQKCTKEHIINCNLNSDSIGMYLHEKLRLDMQRKNYTIDPKKLLEDGVRPQLLFNDIFKDFCEYVEELDSKYNVILMIDEFTYIYDYIRQGKMDAGITKFWKALLQNNRIYAVIIGQDHMMQFVNEPSMSNDFQTTELRKVTYLDESSAKALMSEPIMYINEKGEKKNRYREDALERLYELTSGSAFLIMNICGRLVKYLNEQKSIYITRAHIDDFIKKNISTFEESRFFEPQYNDKSEVDNAEVVKKNKEILLKIARLSYKNEWANIKRMCEDQETSRMIDKLIERDVLLRNGDERCKIKVALYKEWLLERYGLGG